MPENQINNFEKECREVSAWFEKRIMTIRTGRATPELIDGILVEAYGQRQPLKHIASISVPGPRELAVQPWDKSLIPDIERALAQTSLGTHPVAKSGIIQIILSPLTEERRREFVKTLKEMTEEARVRLRRSRDDIWKSIQDDEREGGISEDDKFRLKNELEKKAAFWKEKLEALESAKEREILTL